MLWIFIAAAVLVGGGYAAYRMWFAAEDDVVSEVVMQTGTATRGDLSIMAAGSGTLVPSSEVDLAFGAGGTVMEVLVEVGDKVEAGDVLAWIDDSTARQSVAQAEISVIEAEQALALAVPEAELAVAKAQADLAVAQAALADLLDWEPDEDVIAIAKAELLSAQVAYQNTAAKSTLTDASNTSVRINLDQAISALASAQEAYADAMNPERDWERNIETMRENAANTLIKEQQDLEIAQANYDLAMVESTAANTSADLQSAWAKVLNAETAMADAETPADEAEIMAARNKVRELALALQRAELVLGADQEAAEKQAELALEQAQFTLASAREALDGTTLVAPFAGTITQVTVEIGETASDAMAAIVLADLDVPVMQFWVEEADLANVALGNPVTVVFEALQDYTYRGEITQIDPVLVSVGGTPAVQSWATIDTSAYPVALLGGMNADVEIVAGQALNAVLVPVQALRDLGNGQVVVFVVLPDGELEMRFVEVGLMDYVNVEIISGVEAGEVVSTGETTTVSGSTDEDAASGQLSVGPGIGQMILQGGGGGRP